MMQQLILLGTFFVLPVYLQVVLGLDAFETGKRLFPMSVTMFIAAMLGPRLAAGFAPKRVAQAGLIALVAASLLLLSTIDVELNGAAFALALAVFGVGAGLLLSQLGNVIMSSVDPDKTNEAGGLQGTAQNLGASLGTALIGAVLIAALTSGFVSRVEENPAVTGPVSDRIAQVAEKGIPVVPVDDVEQAVLDAGVSRRGGDGDRRRLRGRTAAGAEAGYRRGRDLRPALAVVHPGAAGLAAWPRARIDRMTDVQASLEEYRDVREALERAVLPLATSVDGRRFSFQTSLHELELEAGGYVTLDGGGSPRLGQVLSLELGTETATGPGLPEVRIRAGHGEGVVLDGDGRPFHDATMRSADPEAVGDWLDRIESERASLDVGELSLAAGRAGPARRRRLRAPHVPLRPIGLGQDLLAGRPARAAPDGDEPARGRARPELGLRATRRAARGMRTPARSSASRRWRAPSRSGAGRTARTRSACASAS